MNSQGRLEGLDLARYLAFVGMVIVNFKFAMGAEGGTGWLSTLTAAVEGRAAATFVVLAGIGLGLASSKSLDRTRSAIIKRAAFLLVIGLLNMTVFDADIIHYYAFYFLFGAFLLRSGNRDLLLVIAALNVAFVIMIFTLSYDTGWYWETYTYTGFWTPTGFLRNLFFNGWHPIIPWLGFLVFGIFLSRLELSTRAVQLRLVAGGAAAILCAEALSVMLTPYLGVDLASTQPIPPMPLYSLAGLGAASLVVGLCLIVSARSGSVPILKLVGPAGRQTLTLYIAHILIGMGTLEAMGLLGGQTVQSAVIAALVFCLASTIYAFLWAKWFTRGPVEALMRKITG